MSDITFARMRWPSLAQDIALIGIPNSPVNSIDDICDAYGLTKDELRAVLSVPYFQQLLDEATTELRGLGPKAGLRYKATQLSEALAEILFRKAHQGRMEDKDMLKLLENLLKASGLDREPVTQVNVQTNVALPFPKGVKKVEQFLPQGDEE